ncbi:hypothetical protein ABTN14_19065, partial [Acinetobacter baumannii]
AEADEAYEEAIRLSLKTYGAHDWRYWHESAWFARMLHMRGERKRSLKIFDDISKNLPDAASGYRDSFEEGQVVFVRGQWARCMTDEGRPQ